MSTNPNIGVQVRFSGQGCDQTTRATLPLLPAAPGRTLPPLPSTGAEALGVTEEANSLC